jgi:hypothetical protein
VTGIPNGQHGIDERRRLPYFWDIYTQHLQPVLDEASDRRGVAAGEKLSITQGHIDSVAIGYGLENFELLGEPRAILSTHVCGQSFRQGTETARLLVCQNPDLEGMGPTILRMPYRHGVLSVVPFNHERPAGIAFWKNRSVGPTQAAENRAGHCNNGTTVRQLGAGQGQIALFHGDTPFKDMRLSASRMDGQVG